MEHDWQLAAAAEAAKQKHRAAQILQQHQRRLLQQEQQQQQQQQQQQLAAGDHVSDHVRASSLTPLPPPPVLTRTGKSAPAALPQAPHSSPRPWAERQQQLSLTSLTAGCSDSGADGSAGTPVAAGVTVQYSNSSSAADGGSSTALSSGLNGGSASASTSARSSCNFSASGRPMTTSEAASAAEVTRRPADVRILISSELSEAALVRNSSSSSGAGGAGAAGNGRAAGAGAGTATQGALSPVFLPMVETPSSYAAAAAAATAAQCTGNGDAADKACCAGRCCTVVTQVL
jgi:hypothetical protein